MNPVNAFAGQKTCPTQAEIESALGPALPLWLSLLAWLKAELPITAEQWTSSGMKHGWALRLIHKKRNLLYLGPCQNCFRATLVLGAKAMEAAKAASLPPPVPDLLKESPKYPEGWAVRLTVGSDRDLPAILALTRIKLES